VADDYCINRCNRNVFCYKKGGRWFRQVFHQTAESLGRVEGFIEEMMNGQKVIKVFCREEEVKKDFDKLNEALFDDARKANRYANILAPILNNIGNVLYVLLPYRRCFIGYKRAECKSFRTFHGNQHCRSFP